MKNDIYTELGNKMEEMYDCSPFDRDTEMKPKLLRVLFGEHNVYNREIAAFREKYEFVYFVIKDIKEGNYKLFAKLLQRLESSLVLGVVCRELTRQNKDIPLFTVHDSILTTPEHVQTVKTVLESVLLDAVGFESVVKVK